MKITTRSVNALLAKSFTRYTPQKGGSGYGFFTRAIDGGVAVTFYAPMHPFAHAATMLQAIADTLRAAGADVRTRGDVLFVEPKRSSA